MDLGLKGKVVLITGGAQGIGRSIAIEMAREGAEIAVADINGQTFESVISEIKSMGQNAIAILADVRRKNDAKRMVETTVRDFGRIDILVNNAGLTRLAPLVDMKEDWNLVVDTNLTGTFLCSQAVAPQMISQGQGCIINIASMCGILGWAEREAFASAKAGVCNLTRVLAAELGSKGIRVNCIAPGYIITQSLRNLFESGKLDKEMLLRGIPIGRMAGPEAVAYAVAFLASEKAGYATGSVFVLDGGWTSSGGSWLPFLFGATEEGIEWVNPCSQNNRHRFHS